MSDPPGRAAPGRVSIGAVPKPGRAPIARPDEGVRTYVGMNGIIGMTELALGTELGPEQREYLDMVKSSAVALLSLINDILDFSKIEAGKLDIENIDFSLRNTLGEVTSTLRVRAQQKGLKFACHIPTRSSGRFGRETLPGCDKFSSIWLEMP